MAVYKSERSNCDMKRGVRGLERGETNKRQVGRHIQWGCRWLNGKAQPEKLQCEIDEGDAEARGHKIDSRRSQRSIRLHGTISEISSQTTRAFPRRGRVGMGWLGLF
jgi:hypothetical protein